VAKIASDYKKPDGLTVVEPSGVKEFLYPQPVRKIPGVGKKKSLSGDSIRYCLINFYSFLAVYFQICCTYNLSVSSLPHCGQGIGIKLGSASNSKLQILHLKNTADWFTSSIIC
jgi:hypothetical protein